MFAVLLLVTTFQLNGMSKKKELPSSDTSYEWIYPQEPQKRKSLEASEKNKAKNRERFWSIKLEPEKSSCLRRFLFCCCTNTEKNESGEVIEEILNPIFVNSEPLLTKQLNPAQLNSKSLEELKNLAEEYNLRPNLGKMTEPMQRLTLIQAIQFHYGQDLITDPATYIFK